MKLWNRIAVMGATVVVGVVAFAADAFASPYDFSSVTAPVTSQITSVLSVALPIGGGILALFIGWRVIKRLSH